jgi:predicted dehydrogenase
MEGQRKARVAVIGTGWWSTYVHIPGLKEYPDADLVALCDVNEERLRAAAEQFGVPRTYTDVREMLRQEQLDGAVVAVYHAAHHQVAQTCLDAGLHIMLEKPMVLEAAHGRDLLARAQRKGVEIIVGYPWHYTEIARRARAIVQSGELGPIQFVASLFASMVVEFYRGNPEAYRPVFQYPVTGPTEKSYSDMRLAGGGQGHLQVTHSAGLLFWVTGLRASRVSAFMEKFDVPVDLVDAINVRFEGGAVGVVGSTGNIGVGDGGQHDLRVYCANGYLLLDMVGGTLTIRKHGGEVEQVGPLPPEERYPQLATARNMVDVILGRDQNHSTGEVGLRCVEFLDAAYQSAARGGQPVAVE